MDAVIVISLFLVALDLFASWFKKYSLRIVISPFVWVAWIVLGLTWVVDGIVWYDWFMVPLHFYLSYISFGVFRDILVSIYEVLTDHPE